jgi:C-terminal processing protease CtpA/Prc
LRTRYFYCWLPTLTPVTAADLTKALATGDAGNTAVGLIVDLRGAAQGTPDGVAGLVALLSGQAKPLVLLLNQETAGPAEILAVLLRHNAGATWIGQKTRGCFAFSEPVTLATGDTLLLPRTIREFAGVGLPAEALAPDVAVESGPAGENQAGLTAERFETFPDRDAALRAAVDMLTTIHALTAKESAAPARKP